MKPVMRWLPSQLVTAPWPWGLGEWNWQSLAHGGGVLHKVTAFEGVHGCRFFLLSPEGFCPPSLGPGPGAGLRALHGCTSQLCRWLSAL